MKRVVVAILCTLGLTGAVLQAHHAYAGYFLDRTVAVEGNLEEIRYGNPHIIMKIRTADSTVYTVTWQSAISVERSAGMTKTTLKVGDHVTISAAPSRDPALHQLASVREVRRPRDGWIWRRVAGSGA